MSKNGRRTQSAAQGELQAVGLVSNPASLTAWFAETKGIALATLTEKRMDSHNVVNPLGAHVDVEETSAATRRLVQDVAVSTLGRALGQTRFAP